MLLNTLPADSAVVNLFKLKQKEQLVALLVC